MKKDLQKNHSVFPHVILPRLGRSVVTLKHLNNLSNMKNCHPMNPANWIPMFPIFYYSINFIIVERRAKFDLGYSSHSHNIFFLGNNWNEFFFFGTKKCPQTHFSSFSSDFFFFSYGIKFRFTNPISHTHSHILSFHHKNFTLLFSITFFFYLRKKYHTFISYMNCECVCG